MEIYGLPQPVTGSETVTILQVQNGQLARCTMPLSELLAYLFPAWIRSLPTVEPSTAGVAWDNGGVISIS